jgi:hypothetical protein
MSSVACPALQYFSTLSHKTTWFSKKKSYWTQNVCFDFLCNFCLKRLSHSRKKWERYGQKYTLVFYTIFLSDFNEIWIFSTQFRKILNYQVSRTSAEWGPIKCHEHLPSGSLSSVTNICRVGAYQVSRTSAEWEPIKCHEHLPSGSLSSVTNVCRVGAYQVPRTTALGERIDRL